MTRLARKLLDKAPNKVLVLKNLLARSSPMIWAGLDASSILGELADYPDAGVVDFLKEEKVRITHMIQAQKDWESRSRGQIEYHPDERFE